MPLAQFATFGRACEGCSGV